jgi:hypothetical protein
MRYLFGQRLAMIARISAGVFCALIGTVSLIAQPAVDTASGADQTAFNADREFVQALAKSNQAAIEKLLDAEFTWTDANGKTITRAEMLASIPTPIITDETDARLVHRNYGQVEMVQAHNGRSNILRLWAKRPGGWRLLVYQEAKLLEGPAIPLGTATTCDNPCKTLPYKPKNQNERDVLNGYMALQTATVYHNSPEWGKYVADEFSAASSNSNKLLDKKGRMADLERSKMAGYSPVPVVTMRLFDFGNTFILVSRHQPLRGNAMHITRLWIKRDGHWMEVASYQTRIVDSPVKE